MRTTPLGVTAAGAGAVGRHAHVRSGRVGADALARYPMAERSRSRASDAASSRGAQERGAIGGHARAIAAAASPRRHSRLPTRRNVSPTDRWAASKPCVRCTMITARRREVSSVAAHVRSQRAAASPRRDARVPDGRNVSSTDRRERMLSNVRTVSSHRIPCASPGTGAPREQRRDDRGSRRRAVETVERPRRRAVALVREPDECVGHAMNVQAGAPVVSISVDENCEARAHGVACATKSRVETRSAALCDRRRRLE